MKIETIITRELEVGDLFIFIGEPRACSIYTTGDFLLLTAHTTSGFTCTTGRTFTGGSLGTGVSCGYLNRELDAGTLKYYGNVGGEVV